MSLARPTTRAIAIAAAIMTCAAVLTGAAGLTHAPDVGSAAALAAGDESGPVLQTIPLVAPTRRAEAAGTTPGVAHATHPFCLVGATWTNPRTAWGGTVEVRTRSAADGRWSGWLTLESDGPTWADPAGGTPRGSTDPVWVGESDGVEARVTGTDGRTGPLPAGLRLDLINPALPAGLARWEPAPVESAPIERGAARRLPRVITRAAWGANETIVRHAPLYTTDVQVMFVHHTATGNGYTCRQSAAIVRSIQLYQVRSRGWNDIGYNFLVDKCGNLFEGRKGGVTRPVLGAHTMGFNAHSSAIAVIGNYSSTAVAVVVERVIAQVARYKLGAYGNDPSGRVVLTSAGSDRYPAGTRVTLNRISGHRDTGRTECPGTALYAQLPMIRIIAG